MATTFNKIASYTLGSNATTIDFTSIPSTYTHLILKLLSRDSSYASGNSSQYIQFNGDTANNYLQTYMYGNAGGGVTGTVTGTTGVNRTFIGQFPGPGSATSWWSSTEVLVPNYTGNQVKKVNSLSSNSDNGSGAGPWLTITAGNWSGTAAINRLTLSSDGGYLAGTTAILYGIVN